MSIALSDMNLKLQVAPVNDVVLGASAEIPKLVALIEGEVVVFVGRLYRQWAFVLVHVPLVLTDRVHVVLPPAG